MKNAYTVTATMANVGAATARGATLQLLVDGVVRSTSTAADLAAGTSRTVTFSGVALSKGTHTLTVVADPANTIRESSESNNRRSITQRA